MKVTPLFTAAASALLLAAAPARADHQHGPIRPVHVCTVEEVPGHYEMRAQGVRVPAGYVWEDRTVTVPGRWEVVQEQVTIPGRWETKSKQVQVRAGYYADSPDCSCKRLQARLSVAGGRVQLNLGGHTHERVWIEPVYETRSERVWIPARTETKSARKWIPAATKVERVRVWKPARTETQQVRVWVPAQRVRCCEATTTPRWSVEITPNLGGRVAPGRAEVKVGPARITIGGQDRPRVSEPRRAPAVRKSAVERRAARLERERARRGR